MENLIESIMEGNGASEEISQYTMGLLFLYLAEQMDREEHDLWRIIGMRSFRKL